MYRASSLRLQPRLSGAEGGPSAGEAEAARWRGPVSSGVNFASSGSGVFPWWNLDKQVNKFKRLLRKRIIGKDLSQSVALVSIASGADYADVPSDLSDMDPLVSAQTAWPDILACADN